MSEKNVILDAFALFSWHKHRLEDERIFIRDIRDEIAFDNEKGNLNAQHFPLAFPNQTRRQLPPEAAQLLVARMEDGNNSFVGLLNDMCRWV